MLENLTELLLPALLLLAGAQKSRMFTAEC